jgi:hypothetical protein
MELVLHGGSSKVDFSGRHEYLGMTSTSMTSGFLTASSVFSSLGRTPLNVKSRVAKARASGEENNLDGWKTH